MLCRWFPLGDIDPVWVFVLSGQDIFDRAIEVAQDHADLVRRLLVQFLGLLNGLVHVTCSSGFIVAQSHLFKTLLARRASKELFRGILAWPISRKDPRRQVLSIRQVGLNSFSCYMVARKKC